MSDLLLHNLRTIGTHHCDGKVGEEAADEITRLRAELAKHQESKFHPDWSMLEATRDSLAEHQEIIRDLRDQLHLAEVARAAQVAGLREALLQCGESCSIFDVRSIVRGALAAGKGGHEAIYGLTDL